MFLLQLQYFRELAYEQHVSRTAEKLHISQPALSMTIKKLEDDIGIQLFDRVGRSIKLNQYGEIYLDYVEKVFSDLNNGLCEVQKAANSKSKELRMGLLSPYVWQDLIDAFSCNNPDISISQISIESSEAAKYLTLGEIDFYIGALDHFSDMISYTSLYEDKMVLMVNPKNHLANKNCINLVDAKNEKFIMLPYNSSLQKFNNFLFNLSGFVPIVALECDYSLREAMVTNNYGVSLTTKRSSLIAPNPDIVALDIDYPDIKRSIYIAWKSGRIMYTSMQDFYNFALDYYSSYNNVEYFSQNL